MKARGDGWLYAIAVFAVAAVLFLPISTQQYAKFPLGKLGPGDWAPVLTWFLTAAGFWFLRLRFWPTDARERKRFSSAILLILLQACLLRIVVEISAAWMPDYVWWPRGAWMWVPWFLAPGLTGILIGSRFGMLLCFTGTLMLYLLARAGSLPIMGSLLSSLAGILVLRRVPTRVRVLRAGAATGGVLGLIGGVHTALQMNAIPLMGAAIVVPVLIGILSAFLVLAALPLLEWVLGELSDVSVIEYGTDHPLLDELRTKAPGTWYHSLNVADLAEKAAAQIGARSLFCRASALYHDIGKLKEPALFAENIEGPSPHDQLLPEESAHRIIAHVSYGVELARRHRLPKPFMEIIAEHHGVSIVRCFYDKACRLRVAKSGAKVDRASFRYPGPPPSTRESGIIALADAVEAASRSLPSGSDLKAFVGNLFAERITDGELAQCPLSLIDLAIIQEAFVGWLKSRNHFRPAYPALATADLPDAPASASGARPTA